MSVGRKDRRVPCVEPLLWGCQNLSHHQISSETRCGDSAQDASRCYRHCATTRLPIPLGGTSLHHPRRQERLGGRILQIRVHLRSSLINALRDRRFRFQLWHPTRTTHSLLPNPRPQQKQIPPPPSSPLDVGP